jgi:regulator of nucleoside diphosphate kinase
MKKQIFITDFDLKRFKWLLSNSHKFDETYKKYLFDLEEELKEAVIVDQKAVPANIITMHSKFKIKDIDTNEENIYTLVFPFDASQEENKLSILTSIGISVIGSEAGRVFECESPSGKRNCRIEEILFQPESQGNYYV